MALTLDHVILRAADVAATLDTLTRGAGLPVLSAATEVGGMTSGIARAGSIDVEVLAIGKQPPATPQGYGIGFVADGPMEGAVDDLRTRGFPVSAPVSARAGDGAARRTWRAAQVAGLLPDPFPIRTSTRSSGVADRISERVGSVLTRVPSVARAATSRPGASMVVLTEYGFDVEAVRGAHGRGPEVVEVHVNAAGHHDAWRRLPLADGTVLRVHDRGPAGITRIVFAAPDGAAPPTFACGQVTFEFRRGDGELAL